jgi:hypothetical protein
VDPLGILIPVPTFSELPTVDIENPLTKVKFAAFTTLLLEQIDGVESHVFPTAGVNTSPFAITAYFPTNTFPTGGDNGVGGVTQGHPPPLSTPKNIDTGLAIFDFFESFVYLIQILNNIHMFFFSWRSIH